MMFSSILTESASGSDASTPAGVLVVLVLLGVAMLWAYFTPDDHPDTESMERHRREREGLARSVEERPARGGRK